MPVPLQAALWGLLGGSALLVGALIGYFVRVPRRLLAGIMAFGAGVLVSALSFELVQEAYNRGGLVATGAGFLAGAVVFTAANSLLARHGAHHRKRSGPHQPSEDVIAGSGAALAIGALLDGVPEAAAIGVSMLEGHGVSLVAVAAVFLSNVPEGMSSAAGMRRAGRKARYVFGVWGGIALSSGVAAFGGYEVLGALGPTVVAATMGVAAGAILAMLADTMLPEAFEHAHQLAGLITALGFLLAFTLRHLR